MTSKSKRYNHTKFSLTVLLFITFTLTACSPSTQTSNTTTTALTETIDSAVPTDITTSQEAPITRNKESIIKAAITQNSNYIYHMLSVAKCGYDNNYGDTNKSYHSAEDLQILKQHETLLTVIGGEHSGDLYTICVSLPASLDDSISLVTYFEALADLFSTGSLEQNFETYQEIYEQSFATLGAEITLESMQLFYADAEPLKQELTEICSVLRDNYTIYINNIWPATETELTAVVNELNEVFSQNGYDQSWESLLNCTYPQDTFQALITNSMENGANCINITSEKDIFYHEDSITSTINLISHEFGIYMLMAELDNTPAFQDFTYFRLAEGLAEYYNTIVTGDSTNWEWADEYVEFYRQQSENEPELSAEELFWRAADHFVVQ